MFWTVQRGITKLYAVPYLYITWYTTEHRRNASITHDVIFDVSKQNDARKITLSLT